MTGDDHNKCLFLNPYGDRDNGPSLNDAGVSLLMENDLEGHIASLLFTGRSGCGNAVFVVGVHWNMYILE